MIVDQKSPHFRYARFFWHWSFWRCWMPSTLCSYFWGVVLAPLLTVLTGLGGVFIAALALGCVAVFVAVEVGPIAWAVWFYLDPEFSMKPGGTLFVMPSWIIFTVAGLQFLIWYETVVIVWREFVSEESNIKSFIGVTAEYVSSAKQSLCPLIDYR